MGLFKNEAIAAGSPFRTGPLRTLADVETLTMNYVDWYNNHRLHSLCDLVTPEEAVRLVINTGRAVATVARELGINEATLGRWVNAFRACQDAGDG